MSPPGDSKGKRPAVAPPPSSSSSEEVRAVARGHRSPGGISIQDRLATRAPARVGSSHSFIPSVPPSAAAPRSAGPEGSVFGISPEKVENLRVQYRIPDYILLSAPGPEDKVNYGRPDRVALYEEFLRCGLRPSFHPFILNVLDRYDLVPVQLTPNSVRIICAFIVLCTFHHVEAGLSLFRSFFKLRQHSEAGWWIFTSRLGRALSLRLPSKVKGWKSRFFYAHVEGVRTKWRMPDTGPNRNAAVDERDREAFDLLSSSEVPPYWELLTEENLYEAELVQAIGEADSDFLLPSSVLLLSFFFTGLLC